MSDAMGKMLMDQGFKWVMSNPRTPVAVKKVMEIVKTISPGTADTVEGRSVEALMKLTAIAESREIAGTLDDSLFVTAQDQDGRIRYLLVL